MLNSSSLDWKNYSPNPQKIYVSHYNLYRRHGSLRRELKVKTPFNAVEKWHKLDPEIFKEKPIEFEKKILNFENILNKLTNNNLVKLNK